MFRRGRLAQMVKRSLHKNVLLIGNTFESHARIFSSAIFLVSFMFHDVFCTNARHKVFKICGFANNLESEILSLKQDNL